ncbi:MAG: alpha/beta hydrolase [Actinomycetota bacterium]
MTDASDVHVQPDAAPGRPPRPRRGVRRWATAFLAVVVLAWTGASAYAAVAIARGGESRKVHGDPGSVGLAFEEVSYGRGRPAWYVPGSPGRPVIVVVHGYGNDRSATLDVGPPLHELGYGLLFVDLGYVSGRHAYGGGRREARDVADAARFARDRFRAPVVLLGFSAGGLASLAAAAAGAPVAAVVSDSGFAGFRDVVAFRAGVSRAWTGLLPVLYPVASGGGRLVDLGREIRPGRYRVPTLLIQGDADRTVPPSSGARLAALTGGELWTLRGVGHAGAFHADEAGWLARVDRLARSAS